MLSEKELARLTNRFQIPLITQDILDGEEILSPDVQYGLHEVLSDYQPDSALLCMALSLRKVAARYERHGPHIAILGMECERIIADYAEMWLRHADAKTLDDNLVFDTLEQIPEDLEALAELIEINMPALRNIDEDVAGLCEILAVQARTQVLIADTFVDILEQDLQSTCDVAVMDAASAPLQAYNDNVIPFPGSWAGNGV